MVFLIPVSMKFFRILCLLGILLPFLADGQNSNLACHRTTEGTEFWFGFMQGRSEDKGHFLQITVTSRKTTSFEIFIGKSTVSYGGIYTVGANQSVQVTLPPALAEPTGSETIQDKAIRLVAGDSVNVYALNWDKRSSDVAVILPVRSLGKEYYTLCYKPHVNDMPNHGRNSEFLVVASEDSTIVEITPSVVTSGLRPAGVPFTVPRLNKGELFQVQSLNAATLPGQGDLSGSFVKSDKPVAVFAGSLSTTIPYEATGGWDHLYEQMPPVKAWGQVYFTVPLKTRSMDYYRIMASQDATNVLVNGRWEMLQKGEWREYSWNTPSRLIADKPILVAQYSQSRNNDRVTDGDGFMVILSPVSQAKNDVTFEAYSSAASTVKHYYINIVIPASEENNVFLDNQKVTGFAPFPEDLRYAYVQQTLSVGTHRLVNQNPYGGFVAYVYGYGGNEAFGYGVGFNLNLTLELSQGLKTWPHLNEPGDTLIICQDEAVKLDAGPYFDYYQWNTGYTERAILATRDSTYSVTARTIDGCVLTDSIYIGVRNPRTDIGPDIQHCPPHSAHLDGGEGFTGYLWSTGEKSQTITVSESGNYSVKAFDSFGCPARDTLDFFLYPVPEVEIEVSPLICGSKDSIAEIVLSGSVDPSRSNGSFLWDTDKPEQLAFRDSSFTSARFSVGGWGDYEIRYALTTVDGCLTRDSVTTHVHGIPDARIETATPGTCGEYNREIKYTGSATAAAHYYWDYGGLAVIDSSVWNRRMVSLGIGGTLTPVTLVVRENGCLSDTGRVTIGANPDFAMNTTGTRGCDSATVIFSGTLGTQNPFLDYWWNFGDGSPDSTSMLPQPSHFFARPGSYDVALSVLNRNSGCRVGYTVQDMVTIFHTPVAMISVDPEVCHDDTISLFYTLNTGSSFCEWQTEGARMYGGGNDTIQMILDQPVATVLLRVNEYGCLSEWKEEMVKRKPRFDFEAEPTEGCQPLEVVFTPAGADEFLVYHWQADTMNRTGNEAAMLFQTPGSFTVQVEAFSPETGCQDLLVKKDLVRVHPKPEARFSVDYPVAILGQAHLTFSNESRLAGRYFWDFGDGFFSNEPEPRHTYSGTGKFPVALHISSDSGCLDSVFSTVEILPFELFSPNAFRPASEIPANREFRPVLAGADPVAFRLRIFNRWGQLVFETRDPLVAWDGNQQDGKEAPMGNYIWTADYTDIQGFPHSRKGQVLLLR